jgi:hypothetical protein
MLINLLNWIQILRCKDKYIVAESQCISENIHGFLWQIWLKMAKSLPLYDMQGAIRLETAGQ